MSAIPLLSNMLHTRNLRRSIEREKIGTAPSHNLQNEMFSKSMHQQQNKEQQNQTVNVKLAQPPAQAALEGGAQQHRRKRSISCGAEARSAFGRSIPEGFKPSSIASLNLETSNDIITK